MNPLLEPSTYEVDGGDLVGRDPRTVSADDIRAAGLELLPALKAARAKCLDCSGGSQGEVRKCVATSCALWLFRMGSFPRHLRKALKEVEGDDDE